MSDVRWMLRVLTQAGVRIKGVEELAALMLTHFPPAAAASAAGGQEGGEDGEGYDCSDASHLFKGPLPGVVGNTDLGEQLQSAAAKAAANVRACAAACRTGTRRSTR